MNEESIKPHTETLHDVIHVLLKYRQPLDKNYSKLTLLKDGLDFKVRKHRNSNPTISLKHLQNLQTDLEDVLHHDATIRMAQPFEEY
jgi:hypothetical protein